MGTPEPKIRTTLAERTAEVIRRRILTLQAGYQPGDRLYPSKLAEDLGVSVTPVREALALLAAEGLVEPSPRRGVNVVKLSVTDLDDLISVRAGFEMMAIRFSGCQFTAEEIARLEECLCSCERAIDDNDIATYFERDREFHRLLVAGSRSRRLTGLYQTVLNQARILEIYNPRFSETVRESLAEDRQLLDELRRGDPKRAEEAVLAHWQRSRVRLRRKIGDFIQVDDRDRPSSGEAGSVVSLSTRRQIKRVGELPPQPEGKVTDEA